MKALKNLIIRNKANIVFCFVTFICMVGLYTVFNHSRHDLNQVAETPKPTPGEKSTPFIYSPGLSKSNSINHEHPDPSYKKPISKPDMAVDLSDPDPEIFKDHEDVMATPKSGEMADLMALQEIFKDSVINENTIKIFEALRLKFNDSFDDLDDHFGQVKGFVRAQIDDDSKVDELLSFYTKYTEFEMDQTYDPHPSVLENPENPEEAIRLNTEKQRYQREIFGQDVADTLWGQEVKLYEYKMKELEILRDDIYSVQVKEQLIADLKKDYFENSEIPGEQRASMDYDSQFYVKLAIYGKDLMAMSDEERIEKIKEFRNEIYPPDQANLLNQLEKPF